MADIQQKRIFSLTALASALADWFFVVDKSGATEAQKISGADLNAALNHENFAGLQGGSANDHKHLTTAELTALQNSVTELDNLNRGWIKIAPASFENTPASANSITTNTDLRNYIAIDSGLRIVQGSNISFHVVTDITASTITFKGENLFNSGIDIDSLYYCLESKIGQMDIDLSTEAFASATVTDALTVNFGDGTKRKLNGFIIYARQTCKTADTGTDSTIMAKNSSNDIFTSALTFSGTDSDIGVDSTYNGIIGYLRLDTVNSGNKDTKGATLTIFYLPTSQHK